VAPATDIFGSDEKLGGLELVEDEMPAADPHPTVSVVVPLYNEASTIGALYHQVAEALSGVSWEIVYVDDGSTDTSYAELAELHAAHSNVRVVRLRRNFGKAAALSAGFGEARGDIIVTLDAVL